VARRHGDIPPGTCAKEDWKQKGMEDRHEVKTEAGKLLMVRTERECRMEKYRVKRALVRKRRSLFEQYYGNLVDEETRMDFYLLTEWKYERPRSPYQHYPKPVQEKMDMVRRLVRELRGEGVDEGVLNGLFVPERKLSRLFITNDYQLILQDYGDMEIKMSPLPKAVFLFFLNHPEGIVFKELPDYISELLSIYRDICGKTVSEEKMRRSIMDVCNPLSNSINEKCARIREAFCEKLDAMLAATYCVQGGRGMPKRIPLPDFLVRWE